MKIVITSAALGDLGEIRDFIGIEQPIRAETFVDELLDRCEQLADTPEAYPVVARFQQKGIRKRSYRDYLIFYRVLGDQIDIVRVLHGARDYERWLASDE